MSKARMLTSLYLLFQVLGLFSSVHAVLNTRTAQGAIAWAVSLNAMPVVAVPAYWVFGRSKFQGYVDALKDRNLVIRDDKRRAHELMAPFFVPDPDDFPEYEAIKKLSTVPFLHGNEVDLLIDGEATYDSLEAGIRQAKSYILFQFYILQTDATGERFRKLLSDKASQGVKVYVLYDELGSSDISRETLQRLRATGIQVAPFNTTQGPRNRFQLNFRNHRKIMVVDGTDTWIGGLNIGDEYLGKDRKLSPWRDTHLHIQGPAALVAQSIFWSDWYWADHNLIDDLNWTPSPAPGIDAENPGQDVLVLGSGPADELETASLFFTTVLSSAKRRIWIATPYFIPDETTQVSLYLALLKGLDVRIITPRKNDNWFVRHAANVYLSELSKLGARIYFYEKGFMHQKTVLVDDSLSLIGTVNFDNRSFRLNFEVTAAVADKGFAGQVEKMLQHDLENSTLLEKFDLQESSLWERLKARGSALLSPVL